MTQRFYLVAEVEIDENGAPVPVRHVSGLVSDYPKVARVRAALGDRYRIFTAALLEDPGQEDQPE